MPRRDPELPEGTDQIVSGAAATEGASRSGIVARGGDGTTERLVTQVRDQVSTLRGQATDKLRGFADDSKGRATGLLGDFSAVIDDAARSIDERLGAEYGDYARRASDAVNSFAGKVRDKSVDDLLDDTREIVRKSPGVAIAAAAVLGFALMRIVRTGMDDVGIGGRDGGGKARSNRGRNADTTTGGGA